MIQSNITLKSINNLTNIYSIILYISFKMAYKLNSHIYGSKIYRMAIQSLFKLTYSLDILLINNIRI